MCIRQIGQSALSAFVICAAFGSIGCPSLNRWSGPSQDPFFSVAEEAVPDQREPPVREAASKSDGRNEAQASQKVDEVQPTAL